MRVPARSGREIGTGSGSEGPLGARGSFARGHRDVDGPTSLHKGAANAGSQDDALFQSLLEKFVSKANLRCRCFRGTADVDVNVAAAKIARMDHLHPA